MLVVGREPNHDSVADRDWMPLELHLAPKCSLWNLAHSLVAARLSDPLRSGLFKRLCRKAGASPVMIADAFPLGLSDSANNPREKSAARAAVSDAELALHVERVFAVKTLIDRVRFVLISGHDHPDFSRPRQLYRNALKRHLADVPVLETKFLYGTNMPVIREDIVNTAESERALRSVATKFEHHLQNVAIN